MQASTHFPVLTVSLSVDSFCGDDEVSWVHFSASGVASSATASVDLRVRELWVYSVKHGIIDTLL